MKRKTILYTFILTALLLSGCSSKNTQAKENNSAAASPSAAAETTQNTAQDNYGVTGNTTNQNGTAVTGNATATQDSTAATDGNTTDQNGTATQNNTDESTMISEAKAREIALTHAGLTDDQVTYIKSELDKNDTRQHYEIEFYDQDKKEYDYEIDPYTGEILEYDHDAEYGANADGTQEADLITEVEAKKIVLDKVPGATDQDFREFREDHDNGKAEYEGKLYYDQKEYEFEIDAYTGDILEWEVN